MTTTKKRFMIVIGIFLLLYLVITTNLIMITLQLESTQFLEWLDRLSDNVQIVAFSILLTMLILFSGVEWRTKK